VKRRKLSGTCGEDATGKKPFDADLAKNRVVSGGGEKYRGRCEWLEEAKG